MNTIIRSTLATMAIIILFALPSCSPAEKQAESPLPAIVAGKIANHSGEFVVFEYGEMADTLALDSTGSFKGSLLVNVPSYVTFRDVNEQTSMYVSPGDSIFISLDTQAFDETIRYDGRGAGPNNFLAARFLRYEDPARRKRQGSLYFTPASEYLRVHDSIRKSDTEFLQAGVASYQLPGEFVQNEMNSLLYAHANLLLTHHGNCRSNGRADTLGFDESYFGFLKEAELERPDLIDNEYYIRYADSRINYLAYDSLTARGDSITYTLLNRQRIGLIGSLFQNQVLKNKLLVSNMSEIVDFHGLDDLSVEFDMFTKACTDTSAVTKIKTEYNDWQRLTAGKSLPDFVFEQIDRQSFSLSSLKGQPVYIDVWATWCGPCKREIPHLEELQKTLSNENIRFVSLSVDENREAWETMVTEDALGGIQIITGTGWESSFTDHFKINSIPRFILLDHEGNIVSADAPRPSWGEETLSLLKKAADNADAL